MIGGLILFECYSFVHYSFCKCWSLSHFSSYYYWVNIWNFFAFYFEHSLMHFDRYILCTKMIIWKTSKRFSVVFIVGCLTKENVNLVFETIIIIFFSWNDNLKWGNQLDSLPLCSFIFILFYCYCRWFL